MQNQAYNKNSKVTIFQIIGFDSKANRIKFNNIKKLKNLFWLNFILNLAAKHLYRVECVKKRRIENIFWILQKKYGKRCI